MHGLLGSPGPTSPRRVRPTIADNFMLGQRNRWLSFFEACWPQIGFGLLAIRKRKTGPIEDVRKVFESIQEGNRSGLVRAFLCGSPEKADGKTLRANLRAASELRTQIQSLEDQRLKLEWACAKVERALAQASEQEKETIRTLADARNRSLHELNEKLGHAQTKLKELERRLENHQTYWFCSQLLDFLCQARYAVKPLPLANTMAGLPEMGWRTSLERTSRMKRSPVEVHFAYRVFETISRIWRRRPRNLQTAPTEFFRDQILRMPDDRSGIRGVFAADGATSAWRFRNRGTPGTARTSCLTRSHRRFCETVSGRKRKRKKCWMNTKRWHGSERRRNDRTRSKLQKEGKDPGIPFAPNWAA
jgi:hypothetical protein